MSDSEVNSLSDINFEDITYDEPCRLISEEEQKEIEAVAPICREKLVKLYRGKRMTVKEIAVLLSETTHSITKLLRAYGIYKHSHKYLEMTGDVDMDEIYTDSENNKTIFTSEEEKEKYKRIEKMKNSAGGIIPDIESGMDERISKEEIIKELTESD